MSTFNQTSTHAFTLIMVKGAVKVMTVVMTVVMTMMTTMVMMVEVVMNMIMMASHLVISSSKVLLQLKLSPASD